MGNSTTARRSRANKRVYLAFLFAAVLALAGAALGITTFNSRAMTTNYFDDVYIADNAASTATGNTYIHAFSENATVTTALGAGVYDVSKVLFYAGDRPASLRMTISNVRNATAMYVPNVTANGPQSSWPGAGQTINNIAADSVAFQIVFVSGVNTLQRVNVTVTLAKIDVAGMFGGTVEGEKLQQDNPDGYITGDNPGSAANPFLISTPRHLDNIRYFMHSHFQLNADIDLSNYYPSKNDVMVEDAQIPAWRTIGYSALDAFTGSLKGGINPQTSKLYEIKNFTGGTRAAADFSGPMDAAYSDFYIPKVPNPNPTGNPFVDTNAHNQTGGGLFNTVAASAGGVAAEISGVRFTGVDFHAGVTGAGVLARTLTNTNLRDIDIGGNLTVYQNVSVTGGLAGTYTLTSGYNQPAAGNITGIASSLKIATPKNAAGQYLADVTNNYVQNVGGLFGTMTGYNADNRVAIGTSAADSGVTLTGGVLANDRTAGIAGTATNVNVQNSEFKKEAGAAGSGEIGVGLGQRDSMSGGFFGNASAVTISSSKLTGLYVRTTTSSTTNNGTVGYIGGFVGYAVNLQFGEGIVVDGLDVICPTKDNVGGLVGRAVGTTGTTLNLGKGSSLKIGEVNGRGVVGGIAGQVGVSGSDVKLDIASEEGTPFTAEVGKVVGAATAYVGGLVGNARYAVIIGGNATVTVGAVSSAAGYTGGVVGMAGDYNAMGAGAFIGENFILNVTSVRSAAGSYIGGAVGIVNYGVFTLGDNAKINVGVTVNDGSNTVTAVTGGMYGMGEYVAGVVGLVNNGPTATTTEEGAAGTALSVGDGAKINVGEVIGTNMKGAIAGRVNGNDAWATVGDNVTVWVGAVDVPDDAFHTYAGGAFGYVANDFSAGVNWKVTAKIQFRGANGSSSYSGGVVGIDHGKWSANNVYSQIGAEYYVYNHTDADFIERNTIGAGFDADIEYYGFRYYAGGFGWGGMKFFEGGLMNVKIANLTSENGSGYGGMFGAFHGSIRDMKVNVDMNGVGSGGSDTMGGMVARLMPFSTIENCTVTGALEGWNTVGGIAAFAYPYSLLLNNTVDLKITANDSVGGLAGYLNGAAVGNTVTVRLNATAGAIGGLAGYITSASATTPETYGLNQLMFAKGVVTGSSGQNPQLHDWNQVRNQTTQEYDPAKLIYAQESSAETAGGATHTFRKVPTETAGYLDSGVDKISGNTVTAGTVIRNVGTVIRGYYGGLVGYAYDGWFGYTDKGDADSGNTVEKGALIGADQTLAAGINYYGGAFGMAGRDTSDVNLPNLGNFYAEGVSVKADLTSVAGQYIGGFVGIMYKGAVGSGNSYAGTVTVENDGRNSGSVYAGLFIGRIGSGARVYGGNAVSGRLLLTGGNTVELGRFGGFAGQVEPSGGTQYATWATVLSPRVYAHTAEDPTGYAPNTLDVIFETSGAYRVTYAALGFGYIVNGHVENVVISAGSRFVNLYGTVIGAYVGGMISGSVRGVDGHPLAVSNDVSSAGSNVEYIGGFIGIMNFENVNYPVASLPVIDNCAYSGNVTATGAGTGYSRHIGGFVGRVSRSYITNCEVSASTTVRAVRSDSAVGGFFGSTLDGDAYPQYGRANADEINIDHCKTGANVILEQTGAVYAGGFGGYAWRLGIGPDTAATGDVTVNIRGDINTTVMAGGFIGRMDTTNTTAANADRLASMTRVFGEEWSLAPAHSEEYAGMTPNPAGYKAPYASGNVTVYRPGGVVTGNGAGGFVGYMYAFTKIGDGAAATGNVSSPTDGIGGFVGASFGDVGKNCTAEGKITQTMGTGTVGGFVGVVGAGTYDLTSRYIGWEKHGYTVEGYVAGGWAGRVQNDTYLSSLDDYYTKNGNANTPSDAVEDKSVAKSNSGQKYGYMMGALVLDGERAYGADNYFTINVPVRGQYYAGGFAGYVTGGTLRYIAAGDPSKNAAGADLTENAPLAALAAWKTANGYDMPLVQGQNRSAGRIGGVVGYATHNYNATHLLLTDLLANEGADVRGDGITYIGGIVGHVEANSADRPRPGTPDYPVPYFQNSKAFNDVTGVGDSYSSAAGQVGGAIGALSRGVIKNIEASGYVFGDSSQGSPYYSYNAGGLIGRTVISMTTLENDPWAGRACYVYDSVAYGDVAALGQTPAVGGFIAWNGGSHIENCKSYGSVYTTAVRTAFGYGEGAGGAGGFAGAVSNYSTAGSYAARIVDCESHSPSVVSDIYSGGFVGYIQHSTGYPAPIIGASNKIVATDRAGGDIEKITVSGYHAGGFYGRVEGPGTYGGNGVGNDPNEYSEVPANVYVSSRYMAGGYVGSVSAGSNFQYIKVHAQVSTGISQQERRVGGFSAYRDGQFGLTHHVVIEGDASVLLETSTPAGAAMAGGLYGSISQSTRASAGLWDIYECEVKIPVKAVVTAAGVGTRVGGFIGEATQVSIRDSAARGAVTQVNGSQADYVGGFLGRVANAVTVQNCVAEGAVTVEGISFTNNAVSDRVGGFVGSVEGAIASTFYKSTAKGDVTGGANIGGFVGVMQSSDAAMSLCSSYGKVTLARGGYMVGGFVGRFANDNNTTYNRLTGCVSYGDVYAVTVYGAGSHYWGGFVGYMYRGGQINECAAVGSMIFASENGSTAGAGTAHVGGFGGLLSMNADSFSYVKNSYALGGVKIHGGWNPGARSQFAALNVNYTDIPDKTRFSGNYYVPGVNNVSPGSWQTGSNYADSASNLGANVIALVGKTAYLSASPNNTVFDYGANTPETNFGLTFKGAANTNITSGKGTYTGSVDATLPLSLFIRNYDNNGNVVDATVLDIPIYNVGVKYGGSAPAPVAVTGITLNAGATTGNGTSGFALDFNTDNAAASYTLMVDVGYSVAPDDKSGDVEWLFRSNTEAWPAATTSNIAHTWEALTGTAGTTVDNAPKYKASYFSYKLIEASNGTRSVVIYPDVAVTATRYIQLMARSVYDPGKTYKLGTDNVAANNLNISPTYWVKDVVFVNPLFENGGKTSSDRLVLLQNSKTVLPSGEEVYNYYVGVLLLLQVDDNPDHDVYWALEENLADFNVVWNVANSRYEYNGRPVLTDPNLPNAGYTVTSTAGGNNWSVAVRPNYLQVQYIAGSSPAVGEANLTVTTRGLQQNGSAAIRVVYFTVIGAPASMKVNDVTAVAVAEDIGGAIPASISVRIGQTLKLNPILCQDHDGKNPVDDSVQFFQVRSDGGVSFLFDSKTFTDSTAYFTNGIPGNLVYGAPTGFLTATFNRAGVNYIVFNSVEGDVGFVIIVYVSLTAPASDTDYTVSGTLAANGFYAAAATVEPVANVGYAAAGIVLEYFDEYGASATNLWKALTTLTFDKSGMYRLKLRYAQYEGASIVGVSATTTVAIDVQIDDPAEIVKPGSPDYFTAPTAVQTLTQGGARYVIDPSPYSGSLAPVTFWYATSADGYSAKTQIQNYTFTLPYLTGATEVKIYAVRGELGKDWVYETVAAPVPASTDDSNPYNVTLSFTATPNAAYNAAGWSALDLVIETSLVDQRGEKPAEASGFRYYYAYVPVGSTYVSSAWGIQSGGVIGSDGSGTAWTQLFGGGSSLRITDSRNGSYYFAAFNVSTGTIFFTGLTGDTNAQAVSGGDLGVGKNAVAVKIDKSAPASLTAAVQIPIDAPWVLAENGGQGKPVTVTLSGTPYNAVGNVYKGVRLVETVSGDDRTQEYMGVNPADPYTRGNGDFDVLIPENGTYTLYLTDNLDREVSVSFTVSCVTVNPDAASVTITAQDYETVLAGGDQSDVWQTRKRVLLTPSADIGALAYVYYKADATSTDLDDGPSWQGGTQSAVIAVPGGYVFNAPANGQYLFRLENVKGTVYYTTAILNVTHLDNAAPKVKLTYDNTLWRSPSDADIAVELEFGLSGVDGSNGINSITGVNDGEFTLEWSLDKGQFAPVDSSWIEILSFDAVTGVTKARVNSDGQGKGFPIGKPGVYEFRLSVKAGAQGSASTIVTKLDPATVIKPALTSAMSGASGTTPWKDYQSGKWTVNALNLIFNHTATPVQANVTFEYAVFVSNTKDFDTVTLDQIKYGDELGGAGTWSTDWTPVNGQVMSGGSQVQFSHRISDNEEAWYCFRAVTDAGLVTLPQDYYYYKVQVSTRAPVIQPTVHYFSEEHSDDTVTFTIGASNTMVPKYVPGTSAYNWIIQYAVVTTIGRPGVNAGDWHPLVEQVDYAGKVNNGASTVVAEDGVSRYVYFRMKQTNDQAAWTNRDEYIIVTRDPDPALISVSALYGDGAGYDGFKVQDLAWHNGVTLLLSNPIPLGQTSGTRYQYSLDEGSTWTDVPNNNNDPTQGALINWTGAEAILHSGEIWFRAISGAGKPESDNTVTFGDGSITYATTDVTVNTAGNLWKQWFNLENNSGAGVVVLDGTSETPLAEPWTNEDVTLTLKPWSGVQSGFAGSGVANLEVSFNNGTFAVVSGWTAGASALNYTAEDSGTYRFRVTTNTGAQTVYEYRLTRIDRASQTFQIQTISSPLHTWTGNPAETVPYVSYGVSFLMLGTSALPPSGVYYQYAWIDATNDTGSWSDNVTGNGASLPVWNGQGSEPAGTWIDLGAGENLFTLEITVNRWYRFRSVTNAGTPQEFGYQSGGAPTQTNYAWVKGFLIRIDTGKPGVEVSNYQKNIEGETYKYVRTDGNYWVHIEPDFPTEPGTTYVKYGTTTVAIQLPAAGGAAFDYNLMDINRTVNGTYTFYTESVAGKQSDPVDVVIDYVDVLDPVFTVTANLINLGNWNNTAGYFVVTPGSQNFPNTGDTYYPISGVSYEFRLISNVDDKVNLTDWISFHKAAAGSTAILPIQLTIEQIANLIITAKGALNAADFCTVNGSVIGLYGTVEFRAVAGSRRVQGYADATEVFDEDGKLKAGVSFEADPSEYLYEIADYDLRIDTVTPILTFKSKPDTWTTGETDLTFEISMGLSGKYASSVLSATYNGATFTDAIVSVEQVAAGVYSFPIGGYGIVGGTSVWLQNGLYTFSLKSAANAESVAYNENAVNPAARLEINVAYMDNVAPVFTVRARGFASGVWTNAEDASSVVDAAFIVTPNSNLPTSGIQYQVKLGAAAWRDITAGELLWMQEHDGDFPIVRTAEMLAAPYNMDDLLGGAALGFNDTVRFRAYKKSQTGLIDNGKDYEYDLGTAPNAPYYPAQFQGGAGVDVKIDRFAPILTVADNHTWWETGTYNLDFAVTFGSVNAASALNTITQIHNGVQTTVQRDQPYANGGFTAAVAQNGAYTFIARSESGMTAEFSLEDATEVRWIDRGTAPQSPTVAMYVYDDDGEAVQTAYKNAGVWYNHKVEFQLSAPASLVPTSGLYYQYRVQTKDKASDTYGAWSNEGAQYGDWTTIPNTGAVNPETGLIDFPVYSVIIDANGMTNIEFRVFAGRLYTPGTYVVGISDPANVDKGIADTTIAPVAREVGVDMSTKYNMNKAASEKHESAVQPIDSKGVYVSESENPEGWVTSASYVFKFTWPAMPYSQATLAVRLGSENGPVLGAYEKMGSEIVSIDITANMLLYFVLTYDTGETTEYHFDVQFIDNAPVAYTITPSVNVSGTVWTNADATFTFDFGSGNRDSYAFFMYYSKGGEMAFIEISSTVRINGIYTFSDGNLTAGGFDGDVEFRVYKKYAASSVYAVGNIGLLPTNGIRTFALRVDKVTPTVTVTNNPDAWQTGAAYTLNFTVNAGLSWGAGISDAASKIVITLNGGVLSNVPAAAQGVSAYSYPIALNGLYRITAYNSTPTSSGAATYVSDYWEFTVSRMDNAQINAAVISDIAALTDNDTGVWYNGDALFTVNHNIVNALGSSGLAFYYSYDNANWTCFYTVKGDGAGTASDYTAAGSQYFTRNTDYSGMIYFRAARVGASAVAVGNTSNALTDGNSVLLRSFWLNLDNAVPTVTLADTTVYTNGWTTGNATIEVTVVTGISGAGGSVTVYYRNGSAPFQPVQVPADSAVPGDGSNGAAVGQYIYKTNITVTPSDVPISGSVTYTVYAVTYAGVPSNRLSDATIAITQIDTMPNTAINVAAVNADNRWQQGSVSFTLSATNVPLSGVSYMMREAATFNPDGTAATWNAWQVCSASILYDANLTPNFKQYVQFGLKYGRDGAAAAPTVVEGGDRGYKVQISNDVPEVVSVENVFAEQYPDRPSITAPDTVRIEVDIDWGFAGEGTWHYQTPGSQWIQGDNVKNVNGKYEFYAAVNGEYTVRAVSASRVDSVPGAENTKASVTEIEETIDNIKIEWTVRGYNTGRWTQENVAFDIEITSETPSGTFVQYRLVPTGVAEEDAAAIEWKDLTDKTGGENPRPGLLIGTGASDTEYTKREELNYFDGTILFRAYAGADTNMEYAFVYPTTFSVRIDQETPSIAVTDSGTGWTNEAVVLRIEANSGSPATWTVSKNGGAAVSLGSDRTYTAAENGTYVFTITTESGTTGTDTITVNRIIPATEGPNLLARINGTDHEDWQSTVNAQSFKSDVTVALKLKEGVATTWTVKNEKGEDVKGVTFTDNVQTFSKNGNYMITLTDEAGNETTLFFTIAKPNYAMIAVGSVLGVAALAVIGFLVFINIRNKKALQRLISQTGQSDESNKFLMFKKIK